MTIHPDPDPVECALRVLRLVEALHLRGYEQLRIIPGMARTGVHWRCYITPARNLGGGDGMGREDTSLVVFYSTGMGARFFDWEDAADDEVPELAAKFIERFPEVMQAARGVDAAYVIWYREMLEFAAAGHFPVAFADWYGDPPTYLAKDGERELPYPPPPPEFSLG